MTIRQTLILALGGLVLAGCYHTPGAWQSSRPIEPTPTIVPTATPTATLEQVEGDVSADIQQGIDEDLKKIDEDLKAVDKDLQSY